MFFREYLFCIANRTTNTEVLAQDVSLIIRNTPTSLLNSGSSCLMVNFLKQKKYKAIVTYHIWLQSTVTNWKRLHDELNKCLDISGHLFNTMTWKFLVLTCCSQS